MCNSPIRTRDEPLNSGARCLVFQALTSFTDHPNPALEGLKIGPQAGPEALSVKGHPKALARQLQAILDAGEVQNRAELARRLRLSRARITQVLQNL